jgi:malic enzyme-like protein
MTDSVLTFPAYAVRAVPWFPAKGGNNVAMGPSVSYSITVRLEVASRGRAVSEITRAVEQAGGVVTALDVTAGRGDRLRVDVTCAARGEEHSEALVNALAGIDGVTVHKVSDRTFLLHLGGKIEMRSKVPLRNRDDLSMAYTPGVGRVAMAIAGNREDARRLTVKRNSVAVVTDGSAVFALANPDPEVDPEAAMEHAAVVATGRSDYPNQINNVLAFPGMFRGLLDAQSRHVSDEMLIAAAQALADVVSPDEIGPHYIIPSVFHPDVASSVAVAVRDAATRQLDR